MAVAKRRKPANWNNLTLKEKYQQHWESKSFQPSDQSITRFGKGFVFVNTVSLAVEGFALLLPHYFSAAASVKGSDGNSANTWLIVSKLATVYLCLGTAFQWWYLHDGSADKVSKSTSEGISQDEGLPQGWLFCSTCKLYSPPRSHHCTVCNICVLKRDHHCFFSGSCVGYHNQRHFIIFLFYACVASAYGFFMQGAYLKREEGVSYFIALLAMWRTMTRQSRCLHLVLLLHFYLCGIIAVACVSFVSWQFRIIFRGQTSYEAVKGFTKYCKIRGDADGVEKGNKKPKIWYYGNFVSACGSPLEFLFCIVVPFVKTKLPGDGIKWTT
ncbi:palmitoyltransferase [Elysia marginata]|uniref:Palmitoyltransferase n=1 Tax=Elysia marginata TaxID=1093978 RepID=A0AAV4FH93_9GAST|nr:palmitoyltransferase [Elysia marginata]